jgi:hypothetical protein
MKMGAERASRRQQHIETPGLLPIQPHSMNINKPDLTFHSTQHEALPDISSQPAAPC